MSEPTPAPPAPAEPLGAAVDRRASSGPLALHVGVVVVAGMYFAREVLIPITLAVLLSFILAPVVRWLRYVLPRVPAVLLAVTLALGIVLSLGGLIGTQIASLAGDVPQYR